MKMSTLLYNRRLHGESVLSAPEQADREGVVGLIYCNGVVHTWDHVKSASEYRVFFQHCATTQDLRHTSWR